MIDHKSPDAETVSALQARLLEFERREQAWRATEHELRQQIKGYQRVLDALPMRIFWKDAQELRYLGCNLPFARDAGRNSPADMVGQDDYAMGWATQADAYRADDRLTLESREARVNYEEPQSREDGTEAWLRTSKLPLFNDEGELIAVVGTYEDITEIKRAEQERLADLERMLESQQDTLRELSTPLIPLTAHVVVMPLVGAIDTRRAGQIMETLLEGVAQLQADFALLDISGVRVIDTQVADALLRTARAAKLLGVQVMLTGMSAEIAQTVVHLGADMNGIITSATLREGLQYADRYLNAGMTEAW